VRRILLVLTAIAMMALMMGASIVPAAASSNVVPHRCGEFPSGDTLCQHTVETPSGIQNLQIQQRGDLFAHEGGATQSGDVFPKEKEVVHDTVAPSGNFNTIQHQDTTQ
jgi:hypothetical protein